LGSADLAAQLESVAKGLEAAGIATTSAEIVRLPNLSVRLEGAKAQAILRLMEVLEDLDDVQKVYANFDIPESELAEAE
jgi:transcriptional/translational regulatory protein YebC/TACO1